MKTVHKSQLFLHFSTMAAIFTLVLAPAVRCRADSSILAPVENYFATWFDRVNRIQAEQPHWITPLVTVTPRLEEEFRYDQVWQSGPLGKSITNYGGSKGLELIPFQNIETILGVPGYISHGGKPPNANGWADWTFLLKYRVLSANEDDGNYIVTLFMGVSAPTGNDPNSDDHVVYSPQIAFGKGWGNFDFQSTVGVSIPDGGMDRLGMPLRYNTAFQYHIPEFLAWPELEVNYTWWPNGEREGKNQVFLTPGIMFGRIPIWKRVGITVGAGYQVAVTSDPQYNNAVILSLRMPF